MKPSRFTLILAVLVTALFTGGTAWAATNWYADPAGSDANTCLAPGAATACKTINGAIGKASAGDTINVAVGTYNEQVNINKDNLKVLGAQNGVDARTRSGAESIIDNACGPVQIRADNVTLDGFTVQGSTSTASSCFFAGIWTSNANSGHQLLNNIVQNNIIGIYLRSNGVNPSKAQFNLIQNNNNPGSSGGSGIYSDSGLSNALIDSNNFVGQTSASVNLISTTSPVTVSGNVLDAGIGLFASSGVSISGNASVGNTTSGTIYVGGGNSAVTITGNALVNGVEAIVVEDLFALGVNSGVTANGNCISGNSTAGLRLTTGTYSGPFDATSNWWGAVSGPRYNGDGPGTGDKITDPDLVVSFTPFLTVATSACNLLATPLADFRDVRRPADINLGTDVCGTGNPAINLTGSTGSAGDTWITVYDTTPADDAVQNTFGSVSLSADVIIRPFNNRKGAGLLALFNEGPGKKGLALVIYDAGNTDTLVLGTVSKANGTFTVLTKVALANRIQECAWYRLTMDVAVDGGVTVTGNVFKHVTPTSPNSAVDGLVGTLSFTGPLPAGVDSTGEVGIVGSAFSAVLDSSVTNFTINP